MSPQRTQTSSWPSEKLGWVCGCWQAATLQVCTAARRWLDHLQPQHCQSAAGGRELEQREFAALLGAGLFVILVRRERHGALGAGVAVSAVVHDFKLVDIVDIARWLGNVLHGLQVNRVLAKTRRIVLVTTGAARRAHAWWRRLRGEAGDVSVGTSSCS